MAAQGNLKSTAITNWDAQPIVHPTAGADGGAAKVMEIVGKCGPTTNGATTGGVLRMVRFPSNIIIRKVEYVQQAATTTANFSFGLYYSDSTTDGTGAINQAGAATAIMSTLWGSAIDTHAATTWVDTTFANTSGFLPSDTLLPIWNATNSTLTSDPGGWFDLGALNTATISGAATLLVRVTFVVPAV